MKMILNRNHVLTTIKGHAIRFIKGMETHVPAECVREALAIGAEPKEKLPEPATSPTNTTPTDPDARQAAAFKAIAEMVEANTRGDFDASGAPNAKVLSDKVGFKVDNKERNTLWQAYQDKVNAERKEAEAGNNA